MAGRLESHRDVTEMGSVATPFRSFSVDLFDLCDLFVQKARVLRRLEKGVLKDTIDSVYLL
jgi:hypothetical protein